MRLWWRNLIPMYVLESFITTSYAYSISDLSSGTFQVATTKWPLTSRHLFFRRATFNLFQCTWEVSLDFHILRLGRMKMGGLKVGGIWISWRALGEISSGVIETIWFINWFFIMWVQLFRGLRSFRFKANRAEGWDWSGIK